jgi:hypothetical protein
MYVCADVSRPAVTGVSLALKLGFTGTFTRMTDRDSVRRRIISSVFSRRNASGVSDETYIAHVKIWEDAGQDADLKPRYILLARTPNRLLCVNGMVIAHFRKSQRRGLHS